LKPFVQTGGFWGWHWLSFAVSVFGIGFHDCNMFYRVQNAQNDNRTRSERLLLRLNSLRTDGNFCHQGRDTEIAQKKLRLSKHTDMTIHWKAHEEHFLISLAFRFNHYRKKFIF
jgi:hypothetical protein